MRRLLRRSRECREASTRCWRGYATAQAVGLGPVKVNCVLLRGFNDSQIEQFAEFSRREGVIVRFIEWMPLEEDRSWKRETVISMDEIVERLNAYRPLVDLAPHAASETAKRFTFDDGVGEIGIIAPVSQPFLRTLQPGAADLRWKDHGPACSRRATTTCMADMVRGGTDASLAAYIRRIVMQKEARHHIGEPGFREAIAQYGAHRWLGCALSLRWQAKLKHLFRMKYLLGI